MSVVTLLQRVNDAILNPVIFFLFAAAFVVFLWGIFQFVLKNEDVASRSQGKKSMFWGIVGMFIMIAVFGIVRIILTTFGVDLSGQFPF